MDNDKLLEVVNKSGFPLQLRFQYLISETRPRHGWSVRFSEHSWRNPRDEQRGFIDLVLVDRNGTTILVCEFKRVLESKWIFLSPTPNPQDRSFCKAWVSYWNGEEIRYLDWHELTADPPCTESSFCVVNGQDQKSKPMLERVAAEASSATEALALEEVPVIFGSNEDVRVYFSVIVTTATLNVCAFDPNEVAEEDGKVNNCHFTEVPYIRFRKQLSTAPRREGFASAGVGGSVDLGRVKENVVFVVNAAHFLEFLQDFEFSSQSLGYLWRL